MKTLNNESKNTSWRVKLDFKEGLFSSTFWFEYSFLGKYALWEKKVQKYQGRIAQMKKVDEN